VSQEIVELLPVAHGRDARLTFSRYLCSMLAHPPFTLRSENRSPSMLGQLWRRAVCAGGNGVRRAYAILLLRCIWVRSENMLNPLADLCNFSLNVFEPGALPLCDLTHTLCATQHTITPGDHF